MKSRIVISLFVMTVLLLSACGGDSVSQNVPEPEKTVTVQTYNAEKERIPVEIPYSPQRIAVLDMPALDILDALGLGDRIVGSANVSVDYLKRYNPDDSDGRIINLGTVKTADLEKVALSEPDVIFIGRRLASLYGELQKIAPVIYLDVDYEKGLVESTKEMSMTVASLFGMESAVEDLFADIQPRIHRLADIMAGKNVLLGMYNGNALGLMASEAQFNIITADLGAYNLGESVGSEEKAAHGEEASWETIIRLNPEYLFVLDRNSAVGTAEEGHPAVREAIENDLIRELDVYKDNKIVYMTEHANIWYTASGGIRALDIMLSDLEKALLKGESAS